MLTAIAITIVLFAMILAFVLDSGGRDQDHLAQVSGVDHRPAWSRRRKTRAEWQAQVPAPLPGAEADDSESVVVQRRTVWDALRFISGPLPLSIALHAAVLLAILWGVHIEQGRNLVTVNFQAGGGGGTQELKQLNLPEMPMPEMAAPMPIERPIVAQHSTEAISEATHYVRSVAGGGVGIGRGGGIGSGYGRGIGAGFGGFIGGLRRSGLDVALVIDGTGSMKRIIGDVKGKLRTLIFAIHRLVPTTRMGIVVFGGRGEPI